MSNSSIHPIARTLSGVTTQGQSETGNNGNKEVLCIPQSSSITGTSPSVFNVISRTLIRIGCLTPLQRCSWYILQPQPSSSSCHTISMDIPDPLLPLLPIVHCSQQVLKATSCIGTELLYVGSSWSSCICSSM